MEYVYLGDVHGHSAENAYCLRCGDLLVQGNGFITRRGGCPKPIPLTEKNF